MQEPKEAPDTILLQSDGDQGGEIQREAETGPGAQTTVNAESSQGLHGNVMSQGPREEAP